MNLTYKIICGSSQNVPTIQSGSVALAVTSPPYGRAKAYRRSDPNNIGNYTYDEYYKMIDPVYREVFRILMSGRKFVVNITDLPDSSESDERFTYYDYGHRTLELCQRIGFELEELVIWNKGRSRSGGAPGTLPFPCSPMLLSNFEYCYIFRKPGETVTGPISTEEREASQMSSDFIRDVLYTVWEIPPETSIKYHIAPFPIELPRRFIRLYTFVGETVYEPFLGSGTTMLAAKQLQRSCTGVELGYDTEDGVSWLDHIKDRVSWLDSNMASSQVSYEIVNPEGIKITDVVEGLGLDKAKSILNAGALDKFDAETPEMKPSPATPILHKEEKEEVKTVDDTGEQWDSSKSWKKQKALFE